MALSGGVPWQKFLRKAFLIRNLFSESFLNNRLIFGQSRQQSQWKWRTQVSAVPVVPFVPCAFSHGIFAASQDFAQVITLRSSWRLRTWHVPNYCCDRSVTILPVQAISMLCLPISTALGGGTGLVGRVFSNRSCTDTWRDCRMTLPIYNSSTWICSDLRKILDFSNGILAQLVNGGLFPQMCCNSFWCISICRNQNPIQLYSCIKWWVRVPRFACCFF